MEPTKDHKIIKLWADSRRAVPATLLRRGDGVPCVLRFIVPGANHNNRDLVPITWDQFFANFDLFDLSFAFQEHTSTGDTSSLNEILQVQRQMPDYRNWH